MDIKSKVNDVQNALKRAKQKMSSLQNELLEREAFHESEEEPRCTEIKGSLFDIYGANPQVNVELKQRLPSPIRAHCSETTGPLRTPTPKASLGALSSTASADPGRGSKVPELLPRSKKEPEAVPFSQPDPGAGDPAGMMEEDQQRDQIFLSEGCSPSGVEIQDRSRDELEAVPAYRCHFTSTEHGDLAAVSGVQEAQCNAKASSAFNSAKQLSLLDEERNIAFLLKELDTLRDLNKQLRDELAVKERALESRMLDAELRESQLEAQACEKAGALVEEIYKAQRERDQALMARLRLANEERDEALLRAKRLQQAAAGLENINPEESDMDLEELLNRINSADSAQGIERTGAVIVDRLRKIRDRKRRITAEEMNAVIEERDAALARCQRLERDLHQVREQSRASANSARHLTAENNQERAWKEALDVVRMERDRAVEQIRQLEQEMQTLRASCSLLHPPCREAPANKPPEPALSCSSPQPPTSLAPQNTQLLEQLRLLAVELRSSQAQLRRSQEVECEAKERVQKLERLVEVLRKKVGSGSLRTVI
ncbi:mirror-image polydactyly gene 1 protein isoform X2 [Brienomyrus brachyistius]|uniref:mirror-image polydactyly gene 1 protein isoform X2 n=1 Tax=Brienomyrus brachyistius TaxID=42636 RepID=UPI0020B2A659|nr:mirror-image polydactyly gene 1 protein isoform X2 [Brienomyrus brachyistius]